MREFRGGGAADHEATERLQAAQQGAAAVNFHWDVPPAFFGGGRLIRGGSEHK